MSCSCDSSLIGLGLFAAVPVMFHVFLRRTNFCTSSSVCRLSTRSRQPSIKGASVRQLISQAEEIVQRDEGGRGIKDIFLPPGELFKSADEMLKAKNIVIVTGFPCLIDYTPPTETDGPLGAAAIAYTLLRLGKRVTILTDTCNEEVMLSCCASADFSTERFALESFPPLGEFDSRDYKRLARFSDPDGSEECPDVDLFIAIERTGPNYEGAYRTMRNRDMSHLIAPLENILPYNDDLSPFPKARTLRSIGIGDGGNEVGMGKVYGKVLGSKISNAKEIACVVPTDHLIIASVSNWGGYALCAATAMLHATREQNIGDDAPVSEEGLKKIQASLQDLLPSDETETGRCQRMVDAGARDGMTAKQELMVDGMEFSETLRVLAELKSIGL